MTIVVLILFTLLAWVTTGRILSPLRLLTKTAQSITESDMAQRISVKGADEIAELTLTFNEMLDRLQFAFDSQQTFLKDVSHELRTPITVIQGHLEMLKYQPEKQGETIALDLLTRQVWVGDRLVELSTREFLLAEVFLRHPMQVMTREQLLDRIWGYDYEPGTNIVNVYVGHLRRKLGEDRIETVRGVGYRLRV